MFTITIPSIKYSLINACFVCFTYSFTDFGAPTVVGGNYNVLATDIYKQVIGQQNFNMGAVVGIIMMLPTVLSFIVDKIISKKQSSAISSRAIPYVIKPHKPTDILANVFCFLMSIGIVLFFGISLFGSLVTAWPYNLKLTFNHYNFARIASGAGLTSLLQSLKVSLIVAVVGTFIAFLTAYLIEKITILPKLRRSLYFMSIMPNAVPGTVIGLSFILFFNPKVFPIPFTNLAIDNDFNFLYGTTAILVMANIIHYFSVPFITASTSLKRLDKEFETVSDSLNVPFYKTFFKVTVPLSFSAILEIASYYFMNSMITVSAIIFLYTPATRLASVIILNVRDAGDDAEAMALCMVIVGINLVVRLLCEVVQRIAKKKTEAWQQR